MSTTNILDLNNRIDELEKNSGGGGSADSAKRSDIATEFSTETSYTAGNFVYYEGKLYQFNADHAAGAWDPTDVVEANVTDQIVSNASAIAGLTASDVAYDNTTSGLTATDVQEAIDEIKPKTETGTTLSDLITAIGTIGQDNIDYIVVNTYTVRKQIENIFVCVTAGETSLNFFILRTDLNTFKRLEHSWNSTSATLTDISVTSWAIHY